MIRRAFVAAWIMVGGCTADFIVGEDASASGSTGATGPGSDTSTTTTSTSTTDTGTSSAAEGSATMEASSTSAAETSSSTGEPTTSSGTTGMLGCGELAYEACVDDPECIWDGIPTNGVCVVHPCVEGNPQAGECWDALEGACNEMVQCEWFSDPPQCAPILCDDCQSFGELDCMEIPQCEWSELEMQCVPV